MISGMCVFREKDSFLPFRQGQGGRGIGFPLRFGQELRRGWPVGQGSSGIRPPVGGRAAVPLPADNVWDGGMGAVDPDSMVIAVPWPFRDGTGVGEYPSGGMGSIDPNAYTFLDGTYAEDTGG